MKALFLAGVVVLSSSRAFAQAPDASLTTPGGQEVSVGVGGYSYTEPNGQSISIHGPKVAGEYTRTISINQRQNWFTQADVRGTVGDATYDGWCSPFLITPDNTSPNGYALDLGDPSPCNETGDRDWYLEGRALIGKDFITHAWGLSPNTGVGLRHLSNGLSDVPGYRTDNYLYLPFGLTARTRVASRRVMSMNLEYDRMLHGWQKTRDSKLGGGDIAATATAPAFTIDGFSDISFAQHGGWALRASTNYPLTRHVSLEPSYIHWSVSASPVNFETVAFTVNNVTAHQQLGAYEPVNATNEFWVKLGFHF